MGTKIPAHGVYRLNGSGVGYPNDRIMWPIIMEIIDQYHPKLTIINLLDADVWAHQENWDRYLKGIQTGDKFAYELWNMIQSDPVYKNRTTLFITNNHGRHLDHVKSGYVSHGDRCPGCKHIQLIALEPDFQRGEVITKDYDLADLTANICAMMDINMPICGSVIKELFHNVTSNR